MRVTRLRLANVRAIAQAEFTFQAGVNLIVGVNGVGKTTVLEAISRGLAQAIEKTSKIACRRSPPWQRDDIRHGAIAATTLLELELADQTVQVQDQRFRTGALPMRPGDLESEVDVHAQGFQRRGRLKRAQRQAQETVLPESGPSACCRTRRRFGQRRQQESTSAVGCVFLDDACITLARTACENGER